VRPVKIDRRKLELYRTFYENWLDLWIRNYLEMFCWKASSFAFLGRFRQALKIFDLNLFKFKPRLKHGWFHLKLYSMFQDLSLRSIETGFHGGFKTRLKFIKSGHSSLKVKMLNTFQTTGTPCCIILMWMMRTGLEVLVYRDRTVVGTIQTVSSLVGTFNRTNL